MEPAGARTDGSTTGAVVGGADVITIEEAPPETSAQVEATQELSTTATKHSDNDFLSWVQREIAQHKYGDGAVGKKNYDSEKDRSLNEILAHGQSLHDTKVPSCLIRAVLLVRSDVWHENRERSSAFMPASSACN